MKKLMFAAAVAAGFAAFGEIESANVVGYASSALDEEFGAVLTAPQFIATGSATDTVTLGSIIPVGDPSSDLGYNIEIQKLNSSGESTEFDYIWNGTKWVDAATEADASDVVLNACEGLWVYSMMGEAVSFQSAGQVGENDVSVLLDDSFGAAATANGFPVAVKLNDLVLEADSEVDLGYNIEIQKLNSAGESTEFDYIWNGSQWVDAATDSAAPDSVLINPGDGLWVYNMTGEAVYLRFPAPEL